MFLLVCCAEIFNFWLFQRWIVLWTESFVSIGNERHPNLQCEQQLLNWIISFAVGSTTCGWWYCRMCLGCRIWKNEEGISDWKGVCKFLSTFLLNCYLINFLGIRWSCKSNGSSRRGFGWECWNRTCSHCSSMVWSCRTGAYEEIRFQRSPYGQNRMEESQTFG